MNYFSQIVRLFGQSVQRRFQTLCWLFSDVMLDFSFDISPCCYVEISFIILTCYIGFHNINKWQASFFLFIPVPTDGRLGCFQCFAISFQTMCKEVFPWGLLICVFFSGMMGAARKYMESGMQRIWVLRVWKFPASGNKNKLSNFSALVSQFLKQG